MTWNRERGYNCPCHECPDREVGCHSRCERYAAWRVKLEKIRKAEREYSMGNDRMSEDTKRRIWRKQRYSMQNNKRRRPNSDR